MPNSIYVVLAILAVTTPTVSAISVEEITKTDVVIFPCYSPITPPAILELSRKFKRPAPKNLPFDCVYGHGSGTVITKDGYVLTAAHFMSAPLFRVQFSNGKSYKAYLVGKNLENDTAIIKIMGSTESFKYAPIADDLPAIGSDVYTIGNPTVLRHMITKGIFSGFFDGLVVSDVHINFGSSGGGLYNSRGELIGVTRGMIDHIYFVFSGLDCIRSVTEKYIQ